MKPINDDDIRWLMEHPLEARALLLGDFCLFIRVFHFYMMRDQFILMPFHVDLAKKLVAYVMGKNEKQNLYIGLSPRAGKSQLIIYFNAFAFGANPYSNFIYTSYSGDLCVKHSKKIRDIVESDLFRKIFGIRIDPATSAANLWKIQNGGEFRSVPMGGAITGFGAGTFEDHFGGAILVDDFMKADDYRSDAEKQTCIEIFENTLKSRKNRPAKDPTIIIAQRLAKDDLVAYIKDKYPDEWDFYVIPAFNEETGESFWEDRYPKQWLMDMKEQNPFLFYSQYQQDPIAQGGGVIKHEWWRYYSDVNDHPYRRIFITADTANKTKEWNDYSAIGVWGFTQSRRLRLLDMVHAKLEIPELQNTLLALWEKWKSGIGSCKCSAIYVEDKASGTQVIQQLRRVGGLPIMPVIPEKDKLTRVLDVVPQIAAGNVELPESENHPLSKEFLAESDAFSADDSHAHDDMIDMMVMAVMQAYNQRGYF